MDNVKQIEVEQPLRDWKTAHQLAMGQIELAMRQLKRTDAKLVEDFQKQRGPKLDIVLRYDERGVAKKASVRGTPKAFHDALQNAYVSLEGEADDMRRRLASLLPVMFTGETKGKAS